MTIKKIATVCFFSTMCVSTLLFSALAGANVSSKNSADQVKKTEFVELIIGHDKQIKFLLDGQEISLASLVDQMNAASDARHADKKKKKPNPEVRMLVDQLPAAQKIASRRVAEENKRLDN